MPSIKVRPAGRYRVIAGGHDITPWVRSVSIPAVEQYQPVVIHLELYEVDGVTCLIDEEEH